MCKMGEHRYPTFHVLAWIPCVDDPNTCFPHFISSLVVHVPAGEAASSSQRVVRIFHTKRNKEITRMSYSSSVLAVKMNRKTLVVLIETAVYIYDITNMHLLHTISGTPPNPQGKAIYECIQSK